MHLFICMQWKIHFGLNRCALLTALCGWGPMVRSAIWWPSSVNCCYASLGFPSCLKSSVLLGRTPLPPLAQFQDTVFSFCTNRRTTHKHTDGGTLGETSWPTIKQSREKKRARAISIKTCHTQKEKQHDKWIVATGEDGYYRSIYRIYVNGHDKLSNFSYKICKYSPSLISNQSKTTNFQKT